LKFDVDIGQFVICQESAKGAQALDLTHLGASRDFPREHLEVYGRVTDVLFVEDGTGF